MTRQLSSSPRYGPLVRIAIDTILLVSLSGCADMFCNNCDRAESARSFPRADRPIAPVTTTAWASEEVRERVREAESVMNEAAVTPGMTVADIGAGDGYYTIHLAKKVGPQGRVLAQDIQPAVIERLADRVSRERLDNISLRLGTADDPRLPADSFDRIFLVHMYHEIGEPYAFLWRLHAALRSETSAEGAGASIVIVVDSDRPIAEHGTPVALLLCEFEAVGFHLVAFTKNKQAAHYTASFQRDRNRPAPSAIQPCAHT